MRSRILIGLLAGALGGFLGWLLQEHLIDYNAHVSAGILPGQATIKVGLSAEEGRTLIYCVGGLIGLFLGAVEGVVQGDPRRLAKGMAIGALAGIVLGFIGSTLGNFVYGFLGGETVAQSPGMGSFAKQIIARSFGWAFMGLGLGVGSSIASFSPRRILHGAIGGFLGGFLGGFVFDLLAVGVNPLQSVAGASGPRDVGGPSRMVGFTAIGGLTGFFIGLVEELLKQAWVKVLAGRNEGKDFILTKQMSLFGRDERCDVPLYGDVGVGIQHAAIRADGNRHVLIDAGTPAGTVVNGQRVPPGGELLLRDGDMIQIGAHRILFHEKATQKRAAAAPVDVARAKSGNAMPMPAHLCPFCGAPKDAAGNCLCSLSGSATGPLSSVSNGMGAPPPANYAGVPAANPAEAYGAYGQPAPGGYGMAPGVMTASRLVGLEGPYAGQVFPLAGTNMTVGRGEEREIVLVADSTVSRNHARIDSDGNVRTVYDAGSSNGTFVNGVRITAQALMPGDVVQFGSSKFRYE